MSKPVVLLVDDDAAFARSLGRALASRVELRHAGDRVTALKQMSPQIAAALVDLRLSEAADDREGISVLRDLKREYPALPVLMITGFGDIDTAVECVRLGAADFLEKRGANAAEIQTRLEQAIERSLLQRRLQQLERDLQLVEPRAIVGDSAAIRRLHDSIRTVTTDGNVSVLLRGETGTGKEMVARAIHAAGWRSEGLFVAVALCALPGQIVESELFGHEAGAFTDAKQRHIGLIERAHGGVLLLDEIAEIEPALQVKLLRFLEEREFQRLGGKAPIKVDVQIIAATNADLEQMIRERRFREDLYFRLKVREIVIPPLRSRADDIPLLARHFLKLLRERGRRVVDLSPAAEAALTALPWPGNVRQLRNVIEAAALDAEMRGATRVEVEDLPVDLWTHASARQVGTKKPGDAGFAVEEELARAELRYILECLRLAEWRVTEAWKLLGSNDRFVFTRRVKRLLAAHPSVATEFPELVARFAGERPRLMRTRR